MHMWSPADHQQPSGAISSQLWVSDRSPLSLLPCRSLADFDILTDISRSPLNIHRRTHAFVDLSIVLEVVFKKCFLSYGTSEAQSQKEGLK